MRLTGVSGLNTISGQVELNAGGFQLTGQVCNRSHTYREDYGVRRDRINLAVHTNYDRSIGYFYHSRVEVHGDAQLNQPVCNRLKGVCPIGRPGTRLGTQGGPVRSAEPCRDPSDYLLLLKLVNLITGQAQLTQYLDVVLSQGGC